MKTRRTKKAWDRAVRPLSFLWRLRGQIRPLRPHLYAISLLSIAIAGQSLAMPQLTRRIIDDAYPARDLRLFFIICAILVGLNAASAIVQTLQGYLTTHVNNIVSSKVRMRVFQAINRMPVGCAERHSSGMLLERASSDADATANMLAGFVPQVASLVFTTVVAILLMMSISPLVTCLVMMCVPLYCLFSVILTMKMRGLEQQMRQKADHLTALAAETIQGISTAKLFGAGKWLRSAHTRLLRDKIAIAFGMWRTQLVYGRLGWAVTYGWGMLLTCGGWYLVFRDRLLLGEAVALGMYIPLLLRPAEESVGIYRSLMSSSVSAQRISELIEASQNGKYCINSSIRSGFKKLSLQGVSFAYPRGPRCLEKISLELNSGETVVILGPTGSGKTTLLRLLAGMYDWYEGTMSVDGCDLKRIKPDAYQTNVAMVMPENFFFSGTLMENLQIAGSHVDEATIRRTACALGIDSWIRTLPQVYQTRLGVEGMRFSSGQVQKVALLRALLKRPRLLLLDEVTSAMDVESERQILDGIRRLRSKDCLTVITTHHLTISLEPWVDRIVVLADGQIAEQGRRDELYRRHGEYRRLMTLAGLGVLVEGGDVPILPADAVLTYELRVQGKQT